MTYALPRPFLAVAPVTETMKLKAAVKSDRGRLSDHNEDSYLAAHDIGLYLVCDGVGGHKAGDIASRVGCQLVDKYVRAALGPQDHPSDHDRVLANAIGDANAGIFDYGRTHEKKRGLGSTLTVLWFHGDRVLFACVGDSRIYLFRDGTLTQLSFDEKAGRYRLAASLGHDRTVDPQLGMVRLRRGDRFLLCSDGLHGPVPRAELIDLLRSEPDPARCCERLVAAANEHGGPDNITALVADVIEPDRRRSWRFSQVRADATSLRARLRGTRRWLWAVAAVALVAAVIALALSFRQGGDAPAAGPKLTGRIAVLAREANAKAEMADRQGTQKALEALILQAVNEHKRIARADLALHPEAERLYERAADAVWNRLYNESRAKLTRLEGTPVEATIQTQLRSHREQADRIRAQFAEGDYRTTADTFAELDRQSDTVVRNARAELARAKEAIENAVAVLANKANEFEPDNPTHKAIDTHLAEARKALAADDLVKARTAVDAARAVLEEGN